MWGPHNGEHSSGSSIGSLLPPAQAAARNWHIHMQGRSWQLISSQRSFMRVRARRTEPITAPMQEEGSSTRPALPQAAGAVDRRWSAACLDCAGPVRRGVARRPATAGREPCTPTAARSTGPAVSGCKPGAVPAPHPSLQTALLSRGWPGAAHHHGILLRRSLCSANVTWHNRRGGNRCNTRRAPHSGQAHAPALLRG